MGEGGRFAYQPALDGLRAVAVAAVIAYHYHFEPRWAPGGFLGVDAFFVLSGYLITSLLLAEWGEGSRIDLRAFWARRARRLLPALLLVLAAVALAAAAWTPAVELGRLRKDGWASLFYVANWRLVASGQSYFDLFSAPSPLRHLWSLAIEEQFYLLWPLVVAACLRLGHGSRRLLAALCVAGAATSVGLMALLYARADPSRAYYGTDTRAHVLLVGALLALVLERRAIRGQAGRRAVHVLAMLAAFAWGWSWWAIGDRDPFMYRGGFLVFAIAVAAVIASAVQRGSPVGAVLARAPLVRVGRVSYGLYLWHWPVQVFLTESRTGLEGPALLAVRLAVTVAATVASFHLLEMPIRRGALRGRAVLTLAPTAFAGVGVALLASTTGAVSVPAFYRTPDLAAASTAVTSPPASTVAPGSRRLLLVGDSVAWTLAPALGDAARARGMAFWYFTPPGCGVVGGLPVDDSGAPFPWSANCAKVVPPGQTSEIATNHPDLVVWLSSWEALDRLVDGERVRFGTRRADRVLLAGADEVVHRLTAGGARLVVLTVPPSVDGRTGAPDGRHNARFAHLNQLYRKLAARYPGTVSVVDLAGVVCARRSPCPRDVGGVRLRPEDGKHFSPEGARWVVARLMRPLLEGGRRA